MRRPRRGRPRSPDRAAADRETILHRDALSRETARRINAILDTHVLRAHASLRFVSVAAVVRHGLTVDLRARVAPLLEPLNGLPAFDRLIEETLEPVTRALTPELLAEAEAERRSPTPREVPAVAQRSRTFPLFDDSSRRTRERQSAHGAECGAGGAADTVEPLRPPAPAPRRETPRRPPGAP